MRILIILEENSTYSNYSYLIFFVIEKTMLSIFISDSIRFSIMLHSLGSLFLEGCDYCVRVARFLN